MRIACPLLIDGTCHHPAPLTHAGKPITRRPSPGVCHVACASRPDSPADDLVGVTIIAKPAEPPAPLPYSDWPLPVRMIATRRKPIDRGIGDIVERWINSLTAKRAARAKAWLAKHGIDCGCSGRKAWLNARWPF